MQEVVDVEVLKTSDHLVGQHADSLQSETAPTVLEEVFEGVAEQFHHHRLVVSLNAEPVDFGDSGC